MEHGNGKDIPAWTLVIFQRFTRLLESFDLGLVKAAAENKGSWLGHITYNTYNMYIIVLLLLFSCYVMSDSSASTLLLTLLLSTSHGLQSARLLCPWDFPGKNTRVGCNFLLQGIFPTQGSNLHLLLGRWILNHRATWEALPPLIPTGKCWPFSGFC